MDMKQAQEEWLKTNKITVVKSRSRKTAAKTREARNAKQNKVRATPEGRLKANEATKKSATKRLATPEGRAKANEASRESKAKIRATKLWRHTHRMASMQSVYKLSEVDFQDLMNAQQGQCAICKCDFGDYKQRASVDHDHKTGDVRGLLCTKCNIMVGRFEYLMDMDPKVAAYLSKPSSEIIYKKKSTALTYKTRNASKNCETCGSAEKLVVDHNHNTEMIRGILCIKCNLALASIEGPLAEGIREYLNHEI